MPLLSPEQIKSFRFALPSIPEQKQIVESIAASTRTLGAAIKHARRELGLLQEYRTRLIADVVTGKLDVREVAARLPDETEDTDSLADFEAESADEEAAADSPENALEDAEA